MLLLPCDAVCPPGKEKVDGACIDCDAGNFSANAGDTCAKCAVNTYSAAGAATCTPCPSGPAGNATSPEGSDAVTACGERAIASPACTHMCHTCTAGVVHIPYSRPCRGSGGGTCRGAHSLEPDCLPLASQVTHLFSVSDLGCPIATMHAFPSSDNLRTHGIAWLSPATAICPPTDRPALDSGAGSFPGLSATAVL